MVLLPRRGLDARAGIDAPGLGQRDGARDVGGIQAAGHDDAMAGAASQIPIEGEPGAAVEFGGGTVEQQGIGGAIVQLRKIEIGGDARGFPDSDAGGILGGRFVAVQLRHVERGKAGDLRDSRRGFVDEHAHAEGTRRGDAGRGFGREVSRALGIEVEADGGGATGNGGIGVGLVGDAAHLEHHAATSFRRAAAGSPDFIKCSPTRKAWYPAARRRTISAASWMPLSLTASAPAGICSARASEVSSVTSKVERLRLLTPIRSAPDSMAASSSRRLWTSTSALRRKRAAVSRKTRS